MELSERYIKTLEKEGFSSVEEIQEKPHTKYIDCLHQSKVSFCLTDGSVTLTLPTETRELTAPVRFDIPAHTPYSYQTGAHGAIYIFGE